MVALAAAGEDRSLKELGTSETVQSRWIVGLRNQMFRWVSYIIKIYVIT